MIQNLLFQYYKLSVVIIQMIQNTEQNKQSSQKFQWSGRLRHPDIQLYDNIAYRNIDGDWKYAGVLASTPLSQTSPTFWSLRFNFLNSGKWMFAGVCLESLAARGKYLHGQHWWSLGHGHYLVGNSGRVYSHDVGVNDYDKSFQFHPNEILDFAYYPNDRLEVYKRGDQQHVMRLEVCRVNQGDNMRICAYMQKYQSTIAWIQDSQTSRQENDLTYCQQRDKKRKMGQKNEEQDRINIF